jgi:hypothetical protein
MPNTRGTRRALLDRNRALPFCLSIYLALPWLGQPTLGIA